MTAAASVYDRPVAELLAEHGVTFRRGPGGWLNFAKCPMCGHKGYQCGVSETAGTVRERVFAVKCFHPADSVLGPAPRYPDFLRLLGVLDTPLSIARTAPPPAAPRSEAGGAARTPADERPPNLEWLGRLAHRLWETPAALAYLRSRGLTDATIRHFRLGLTLPSRKVAGHDALAYPFFGPDGALRGRSAYYEVPGLTVAPRDSSWAPGAVTTYWATPTDGRSAVLVVEGAKDAWAVWQAVQGSTLEGSLAVITSTHGTNVPEEWKDGAFWERWTTVYVGTDADEPGDAFAAQVLTCALGRSPLRVRVPDGLTGTKAGGPGKDWTDFFLNKKTAADLAVLLNEGQAVVEPLAPASPGAPAASLGRMAYRPVDITTTYVNGALYYPIETLVRREHRRRDEATGKEEVTVGEAVETVVIRSSDRSVHSATLMPAPKGVSDARRVWRLQPDGTMIEKPPRQNRHTTWSWESIEAWRTGEFTPRPLRELLRDVERHFRRSVWLPYVEDYTLLALTTVVTYVQAAFDAVPLLLVNGPHGTGKTTVGRAMAQVAYNASIIGAVSAAAVARHIDETRGFVALDDLESIGSKGRAQDANFGELVQALKLSYNRDTAKKTWVDAKTMRVETLQFFGVKVISNTAGVDNILGSRMFRIQTRKIPDALRDEVQLSRAADVRAVQALRDELHCWAFDHVREVDVTYKTLYPHRTDRADEIAAPLRVIATLTGDAEVTTALDRLLDRQRQGGADPDDPVEVLKEAVTILIREGYRDLSPTHVGLEMARLLGPTAGKEFTNQIPEWQRPDWVGRQLRQLEIVPYAAAGSRPRLEWGYQLRVYPIRREYVLEVMGGEDPLETGETNEHQAAVGDWCRGCGSCPYRPTCELAPRRIEWEQKRPKPRLPVS